MTCPTCRYTYYPHIDSSLENKPFRELFKTTCPELGLPSIFACPHCGSLRTLNAEEEEKYENDRRKQ